MTHHAHSTAPDGRDSEAELQEELRREAAERDAIGGDTPTNRNLSGSSTWVTLGSGDVDTDASKARGSLASGWDAGDVVLRNASLEVEDRLARRGVRLAGDETSEHLVDALDAVERFERAVERRGGDLMVDEPTHGARVPLAPDDPAFVLPARAEGEALDVLVRRIMDATTRIERSAPLHGDNHRG
jgi:hypothetical protein